MAKRILNKSNRQPDQALSAGTSIHTTASQPIPVFQTPDPQAAYEHFLKEAQTIAPERARILNIEPGIVRHNAEKGIAFFTTVQTEILSLMPAHPVNRTLEIPTLALGVMFAYDQVVEKASDGEIAARLAECAKLRSPMLKMLEVLADPAVRLAGTDVVKDIRTGTGAMDKARDAVNIAAYYRKLGPAIAGKHPFTEEQINLLSEHGQWLIPQLTPRNAKPGTGEANPAAVVRDQFYTLLWTRYEQMRGAVAAIRGVAGLDDLVPPLGARAGSARKGTNGTPTPDKEARAAQPASPPVAQPPK